MKKTFLTICLISIFSFSFFSCASKEVPEAEDVSAPETEVTENLEAEETTQDKEEEAKAEEEIQAPETPEETEEEKPEENVFILEDLPEIPEPEVFEEELPPLVEPEEVKEPEAETFEPVEEDETLDLPALPEDETTSEESDENVQENNENVSSEENPENTKDRVESEKEIDKVIELNNTREDEVEDLENPDDAGEIYIDENSAEAEVSVQIVPSRSVSMKKGESLDVVYPGKGWVFLGCTDGSKNLTSTGRKTGDKTTSFTLMARVPGTVILHFYKEDILGDQYIDDYLEVKVSELKSKPSVHVKAPDYSEVVPKKPAPKVSKPKETKTEEKPEEIVIEENHPEKTSEVKKAKPAVKETPAPEVEKTEAAQVPAKESGSYTMLSGDEYMAAAKKALDEKNFTEVYNNLQNFLTVSETGRDEALFLLAQLYEGNSEYRNIKKSVETYEELLQNYPLSSHWEEADKRVIYLKRFYINIR